ncbi:Putative endoglucanase [Lacunisphaera limnophila]|uniref:Endoglucanase n=1 Tax=Lacunisphaera limnophila TaxID=1838286 RepID=A0A1D8AWU9_9BACT|nr:glycoside hydrolase family 140 protein [Lacunisphaera limnophila]AOS45333.1 Putative endoglucanase [Lacunisphaera limnophila]
MQNRLPLGRRLIWFVLLLVLPLTVSAALPAVRVHAGGHHLETADGRPFFWLGDTAWALLHATDRDECSHFLRTRADQGYTVIQANVLAEMNGVRRPSALGEKPFLHDDPTQPNPAYFDRLVEVVDEAATLGLYVALLPAWGDKVTAPWGDGPRLFHLDNLPVARAYGRYLGAKVRGRSNVIWMLGGDRPAVLDPSRPGDYPNSSGIAAGFPADHDWRPIWREMIAGLHEGFGTKALTLYHPPGGSGTSATLGQEPWLDLNGLQSGHGGGHDVPIWENIAHDYALTPAKPTLDLEPNYEDHPVSPWPRWDPALGYFRDHDVRKQCYRSVLAGACGVTYGHHAVWQFAGRRNDSINYADRDWVDALQRPAARQMLHLRRLIESRPFFTRIPDSALVVTRETDRSRHLVASRDEAGTYGFIYFPTSDQSAQIDLGRLRPGPLHVRWYDPRTGFARDAGIVEGKGPATFTSPSFGPDWVLVLDSMAAGYRAPGL